MKLLFDDDVKRLRKVVDSECHCSGCNGENQKCLIFKQATRNQVKSLCSSIEIIKSMEGVSEEWIEERLNEIAMGIVASTSAINRKHPNNSNRVFLEEHSPFPLAPYAIASIAKCHTTAKDYEKGGRLDGDLCYCNGNGEFVICKDNKEGDKVYMQCRKCGGYSHL